jgi:hypothetical protein
MMDAGVLEPAVPLENLHFHGRWDLSSPTQAVTVNSGSYLQATFSTAGSPHSLMAMFDTSLNQDDVPNLTWQIDQEDWVEAVILPELKLAENLAPGKHTLTLMVRGMAEALPRWTAPRASSTTFLDLQLTGGELLPTPRPEAPKLEFLGDSITEGVRLFNDRPGKAGQAWRADARLA